MATQSQNSSAQISVTLIILGRLLVPVVVVAVWEGLRLWLGANLVPGPVLTLQTIIDGFRQGNYATDLINTFVAVVLGWLLASIGGLILGLLLGTRNFAYDLFDPFIRNLYAIPKIVLFPIFLFVFKFGIDQKVAFGAFHGFFPMLIITMSAIREVSDIYLDVAKSLRLSEYQTARYVMLPIVLVQLVVGLRMSFSLTFLGVVLSELFAAKSGIGLQLQHAMANFNNEQILAISAILLFIAFIVNLTLYTIQSRLEERWNITSTTSEV